jgi:hypothetical protein
MKRGDVIWWVVIDPSNREMCSRYPGRSQARRVARLCGGRVAKVVVT